MDSRVRGNDGGAMVPVSFEFYPPKTDEQRAQLDRTAARLKSPAPNVQDT